MTGTVAVIPKERCTCSMYEETNNLEGPSKAIRRAVIVHGTLPMREGLKDIGFAV